MNWPLPVPLAEVLITVSDKEALVTWVKQDPKTRTDSALPHYLISSLTGEVVEFFASSDNIALLEKLPDVNLRLAYEPSRSQLVELTQVIRARLNQPVVVEAAYDPAVVAGLILETASRAYDLRLLEGGDHESTDR